MNSDKSGPKIPGNGKQIDIYKAIVCDVRKNIGHDLLENNPEWLPIHSVWKWRNPSSGENCVTEVLLLPTGIWGKRRLQQNVDDDAYLKIIVQWLSALTNPFQLHKMWLIGKDV